MPTPVCDSRDLKSYESLYESTSMKIGTQSIISLLVSFAPWITDSGVGMTAGDIGSKTVEINPQVALRYW